MSNPTTVVPNAMIKLFASVSTSPLVSASSAGPMGISVPISPSIGPSLTITFVRSSRFEMNESHFCNNFSTLIANISGQSGCVSLSAKIPSKNRYTNRFVVTFSSTETPSPKLPPSISAFASSTPVSRSFDFVAPFNLPALASHSNENMPISTTINAVMPSNMMITGYSNDVEI